MSTFAIKVISRVYLLLFDYDFAAFLGASLLMFQIQVKPHL